jgi:3-methyladenine DNA glycosylase AlkD
MTPDEALAELRAAGNPADAATMAAYHKAPRVYLGVKVPLIAEIADRWRASLDVQGRVALADALWRSDIHEARVAAAKLLVQARIKDDGPVWNLIASWVPQFDAWALADHACDAGRRRLEADPSRLDEVEGWITDENFWVRRAALVMTLPWTRQNHPKPQDEAIRDRVLGWAAVMADDREWFIQKAIAWWLRELSKHDAPRVAAWLAENGPRLKAFARKEAAQYLSPVSVDQISPPEAPPLATDAPEA